MNESDYIQATCIICGHVWKHNKYYIHICPDCEEEYMEYLDYLLKKYFNLDYMDRPAMYTLKHDLMRSFVAVQKRREKMLKE